MIVTHQRNYIRSFPTENWHVEYIQLELNLPHIFGHAVSITQSEYQIHNL